MGAWPGRRETSNLMYNDTDRILTRYLINADYLDTNIWADATPWYLMEVKTTTGDFSDRLYMSSNQYRNGKLTYPLIAFSSFVNSQRCKIWHW